MSAEVSGKRWKQLQPLIIVGGLLLVLIVGSVATYRWWSPWASRFAERLMSPGDTGGHSHGSTGGEEVTSLQLSDVAWKNIRLRTGVVRPATFVKTIPVPARVVERPGRSQVEITAPLTGIVTRVYPIEGEAIQPGQPLFELRLTHEDLVTAQREFLQSAEELDVIRREIQRLRSVGDGVIAGRRIIELEYEEHKTGAALRAQRQGLLLHGLNENQVDEILLTRQLLQSLTLTAPRFDVFDEHQELEHLYHVQKIRVLRGQTVTAGEPLGVLADHCLLYVEGQAFEDDADRLVQAMTERWPLEVSEVGNAASRPALNLNVEYIADRIDSETRALPFYLILPNQLTRDESMGGRRFVAWRYRPDQRMEVRIPISLAWEDQVVLPPAAVVEEGAEAYVFEQNGDHFDRIPVHIVYRDNEAVVIENDGTLIGSTVAMSGAYQMYLALKNKSSGGAVGHGHSH